jgi:anthranilate phosphoribosyltransferase
VLQSGLALFIAGRAVSLGAGIEFAGSVLDSGRAATWLQELRKFAVQPADA